MSEARDLTGEALVSWLHRGRHGMHALKAECPGCGVDCSVVAIIDLAYTFELCQCGELDHDHLVETLWHVACLRTGSHPSAQDLVDALSEISAMRFAKDARWRAHQALTNRRAPDRPTTESEHHQ